LVADSFNYLLVWQPKHISSPQIQYFFTVSIFQIILINHLQYDYLFSIYCLPAEMKSAFSLSLSSPQAVRS